MKAISDVLQNCVLGAVLLALPFTVQAQFTFATNNGALTITHYFNGGPNTGFVIFRR